MLGHLLRKEILDHILSLRFLTLTVLGTGIIALSLYSGYGYYRDSLADHRLSETLTESHRAYLIEANDMGTAGDVGYPTSKPPTAMSIFVRGIEPTLGRTGYIAYQHARRLKFSPVAEEPTLGIFPFLDLDSVVKMVLSLFALLLTYDAINGEKERGTLRLLSSFPIARVQVLVAKILGALIPTALAFGVPLVAGIGIVLMLPDVQFRGPELARLTYIVVGFALYLTVFICAGIFASSLVYREATSFVILLFFWVVVVAIVPRLSLIAADVIRPAPSRQQLQANLRAMSRENTRTRFKQQIEWENDYEQKTGEPWYRSSEGREARQEMRLRVRDAMRKKAQPETERLEEAFENQYNARFDLAMLIARMSPKFALDQMTIKLAGTGIGRHKRYLNAFDDTRDAHGVWYWKELNQDQLSKANPKKYGEYQIDYTTVPRVVYRDVWPDTDLQAGIVNLGLLALWCVLCFVGAHVSMLRYDLR